jgi:hypothetical protein
LTIDPSVGDERERTTERIIKVVADFGDFLDEIKAQVYAEACPEFGGQHEVAGLAPRYPIVGLIGVGEVMEQYLQITEIAKEVLRTGSDIKAGAEAYTDKIQFKTTISGGVKPKVTINQPTGHTFTGSLDLSGSRIDTHEVLIGLYREAGKDGDSEKDKTTKVEIVKWPK